MRRSAQWQMLVVDKTTYIRTRTGKVASLYRTCIAIHRHSRHSSMPCYPDSHLKIAKSAEPLHTFVRATRISFEKRLLDALANRS